MFKAEYHDLDIYKTCLNQNTMIWIFIKRVKAANHDLDIYKTCLNQNTMIWIFIKHG